MPKVGYTSSASTVAVERENEANMDPSKLTELFKGPLGAGFNEDANTFARAQVRATFYPKFENEKSDQEVCIYYIFTWLEETEILEEKKN